MIPPGPAPTEAGLCPTCLHRRLVGNRKGSLFSLCRRSELDRRYPRYPPLPVLRCDGYEKHTEHSGDPGEPDADTGVAS